MHIYYVYGLLFLLRDLGLCIGTTENVDEDVGSLTTSIAGLERLLETENFFIQNLDNYANELEQKLLFIRRIIASLRKENDKARENTGYYISIPTNIFSLVRRLQQDWVYLDIFMKKAVGEEQTKILHEYWKDLPKADDLNEAINAMGRLQDTYDLKSDDLARGMINGKKYDTKLSALDCYALGYELFKRENYVNAGYWLFTAIHVHEADEIITLHRLTHAKIMELYAETLLKQGRHQDALTMLNVILEIPATMPPNTELVQKKTDLELHIKIYNPVPEKSSSTVAAQGDRKATVLFYHIVMEPNTHQRGCRGEFSNQTSKLYCLYNTTTTPYLKLAPLKMEIISLDPYMVIYHDVMSDFEITTLQNMSRPILTRATVYNEEMQKSTVVPGRTSKFAWFYDYHNNITQRINKRIVDMTGFNLTGSEMLQVMNYGLGGHYATHYDFFNVSQSSHIVALQGDRKATVLFYMSDVDQGGATVFPNIKKAIFPKKGTAVVWYNLNERYEADYKTLHSGCPVLVGSKWVTNKWIRERNQMFRLPCYSE